MQLTMMQTNHQSKKSWSFRPVKKTKIYQLRWQSKLLTLTKTLIPRLKHKLKEGSNQKPNNKKLNQKVQTKSQRVLLLWSNEFEKSYRVKAITIT